MSVIAYVYHVVSSIFIIFILCYHYLRVVKVSRNVITYAYHVVSSMFIIFILCYHYLRVVKG